jgi:glycosyltransferase involved in cell wall biosynthesis
VVRCGLEPDFYPGPPLYSDARHLVCVGRLHEQKGQLLLIEAVRRLAEAHIDVTLTLAGDGELRPEIEALNAQFQLKSKVHLAGWISNDEVRKHILAARALVLPSFAEGLPVVIMEAMALRRPVISTYVAGIPELVRDGKSGWLVSAGDVDALVGAIQQCLAAPPDVLQKMADTAFEKVAVLHNVDSQASKLASLFRKDLNAKIVDVT